MSSLVLQQSEKFRKELAILTFRQCMYTLENSRQNDWKIMVMIGAYWLLNKPLLNLFIIKV